MTEAVSTRPTGFIGRNILWLFVSQVLTWMITLIVLILAPDRLGADDFGALNFSIAFVSFFTFVGILGTGQLITRTVARDPDLMTSYVVNGLVMKVLMAIVLSALAIEDESQFVSLSNRSLRLVLAISLPTATGLFLVAFNLMDILYEPEFADSAVIMRILAVHIPLAAISTVLGAVLIASDRQGPYAAFALVAAIANPLLSILFIRWTITWWENGAIGAAIITVGTEFFMVYAAYRLRRRGVLDRATTMYALRCLVACGIMAVPLVAFDGWNMFLKIGVGIVVYGAAAIALRVITLGEILEVPRKVLHARRYTPDAAPPPADDDAGTAEAEPLDGR